MRHTYDFSNAVKGKYAGKVDTQNTPTTRLARWRNPSVRLLAEHGDPADLIVERARALTLEAADAGLLSTPVDPFRLAELKSIQVIPKTDVADAQLFHEGGKPVILYNPNQPRSRIRFSICHELGHALFPDWSQQVRHRLFHSRTSPVDYELEALCNLAAAEMLLPIGSIQEDMARLDLSVETALRLRVKYEASTEAVLLRLAGLAGVSCSVFAAAPEHSPDQPPRYRLEYVRGSLAWDPGVSRGDILPPGSVVRECTSLGFTASAVEQWATDLDAINIEAVGVSPYPNRDPKRVLPRVTGLLRPAGPQPKEGSPIRFVRGDALEPRGSGPRIIAHVVNDKTPNWGAGIGRTIQHRWPEAHRRFVSVFAETAGSKLGVTAMSQVSEEIYVFQMIAQHGYGPSSQTRLRYGSLRTCLQQLRRVAIENNAIVHMPRIGAGEAGGSWALIQNLIAEELCARGVAVTVYDLPGAKAYAPSRPGLFDEISH